MQIQHVSCRKTFRRIVLVAMVTTATNIIKTMAKFCSIKSVGLWLYEDDIHSIMDSVHFIEVFEHPASAISTKISALGLLCTDD